MPAYPQATVADYLPADATITAPPQTPKSGKVPIAAIVGAVLGGMLVLVLTGAAVRRYKRRSSRDGVETPDHNLALSPVPTLSHSPGPALSQVPTRSPAQSTLPIHTPLQAEPNSSGKSSPAPCPPPKDAQSPLPYTPPAPRASRIPVSSQSQVRSSVDADPAPVAPPVPPRPQDLPPSYNPAWGRGGY